MRDCDHDKVGRGIKVRTFCLSLDPSFPQTEDWTGTRWSATAAGRARSPPSPTSPRPAPITTAASREPGTTTSSGASVAKTRRRRVREWKRNFAGSSVECGRGIPDFVWDVLGGRRGREGRVMSHPCHQLHRVPLCIVRDGGHNCLGGIFAARSLPFSTSSLW